MLDGKLELLYRNLLNAHDMLQVCLIFMLFLTFMVGKCGLKKLVICHFLVKRTYKTQCYEGSFKHVG